MDEFKSPSPPPVLHYLEWYLNDTHVRPMNFKLEIKRHHTSFSTYLTHSTHSHCPVPIKVGQVHFCVAQPGIISISSSMGFIRVLNDMRGPFNTLTRVLKKSLELMMMGKC